MLVVVVATSLLWVIAQIFFWTVGIGLFAAFCYAVSRRSGRR